MLHSVPLLPDFPVGMPTRSTHIRWIREALRDLSAPFSTNEANSDIRWSEKKLDRFESALETIAASRAAPSRRMRKIINLVADFAGQDEDAFENLPPGFSFRDNIRALETLPVQARLAAVRALLHIPLQTERVSRTTRSTITKALFFLTRQERLQLGRELLRVTENSSKTVIAARLLDAIISSSQTLNESTFLVRRLGKFNLLKLNNGRLGNHAARVIVKTMHLRPPVPRMLSKYAGGKTASRKLNEVSDVLQTHLEHITRDGSISRTTIARRYAAIIRNNLSYLSRARRAARNGRERRELANCVIKKIALEYRYGIMLDQKQDQDGRYCAEWTAQDLKELEIAFQKIPTNYIQFTHRLARITLAGPHKEDQTYGERKGHGEVILYDLTRENDEVSADFRGAGSLAITLVHELGHAISLLDKGDGRKRKETIDEIIRHTSADLDFADFAALSDWQVVHPRKWKIIKSVIQEGDEREVLKQVRIGRRLHDLDTHVTVDGEGLVLSHSECHDTLFCRSPAALFSRSTYAETDPWEDFCEAFMEYILLPHRLVQDAPAKFLYFEQQFRAHHQNEALLEKLNSALQFDEVSCELSLQWNARQRKLHQKHAA